MSKIFTTSDVASHNKSDDLFIIVDGDVYDLTKFQDDHPGKSERRVGSAMTGCGHWRCLSAMLTRSRRQKDSSARSWQGRIQAILEIPQRGYPEEVQTKAARRFARLEASAQD
jgi:hypothetical protein